MNRKFVGISTRDPSPARRSPPRRPLGCRSTESRPAAPGSPGARRKRRARFEGILDQAAPKASTTTTTCNRRATESHGEDGGGGPKTSEFAFFKRLKEGCGGRAGCGPASSDAVDGSRFSRPGRNTCGTAFDEDGRSFLVPESATPPQPLVPSRSKPHVAIDKSAVDGTKAGAIISEIYSEWEHKVLESDSSKSQGIHGMHEDIFSEKRQRLRRWVAENSSPEVANLCSKGCDFISELLKRLFPENSKYKVHALLDKEQQETDVQYELVTNPESDIRLRNRHGIPIRNTLRHEYGQHPDVDSHSIILSSGSVLDTHGGEFRMNSEVTLLNEPTPDIAFLNYNWVPPTKKLRLECGPFSDIGLLSSFSGRCDLLDKPTPASSTLVDSTFGFYTEERGIGSSSLRELKKCYEFIGSPFDAEIDDMGEDFHIMSRERWESPNSQSTQLSLFPRSPGSWIDYERQYVGGFSLSRSSQSLVLYVPRESPTQLFSQATVNVSYGFEDHLLGVNDDRLGSLVNLPPFSFETNHDHFDEYSSFPAAIGSSCLFHSPRDCILSRSKELQEHPHPGSDFTCRLRHGCNLDEEKWLLQLTGSSSDDDVTFPYPALDHPSRLHNSSVFNSPNDKANSLDSSGNFDYSGDDDIKINDQSSFYKEVPLLLDGSCYYQSEGKKYTSEDIEGMYF